jgi:transposase
MRTRKEVRMSAERLSMRQIRETLRLRSLGITVRKIAVALHIGASTVGDYLKRAKKAGLSWPLPDSDEELEKRLFAPAAGEVTSKPLPDWNWVREELKRKGVTRFLLWQEYKEQHPDGYQYSQFSSLYREWQGRLAVWMRQEHLGGEKLFVDFSGDGLEWVDLVTGEVRKAPLFVAALGASSCTFACALPSEKLHDWIDGHVRALAFFGGVTKAIVPDQPKTAVKTACRYDPEVNPTYADFARHYGTSILPARPRKPRDKAKVEVAVLLAQRWIIAVLRNRTFYSIAEINEAIRPLLEKLNNRVMRKLKRSRRDLFVDLDQPNLLPLPTAPYEYAEWKIGARANLDYHVEFDANYYSVHYRLAQEVVDIRSTGKTIEIFQRQKRVASHLRSHEKHRHITDPAHMPSSHRAHAEWTPSRLVSWAGTVGPNMAKLVENIMEDRPHPEQGFRACMGILHLQKEFAPLRLEKAAARAVACRIVSYRAFKAILKNNLEDQPLPQVPKDILPLHRNVRGSVYYRQATSTSQ